MTDADRKSSNPREIELKFQLMPGSREFLEASPAFTDAASQHHHQVTTYCDTPDQALNSVGITLRVRKSGRSHIQTVKSRANRRGVATNRNEWEWPIGGDCPDLSHLLQTHGLAKIAQAIEGRLVPVFLTNIRRTIHVLYLTDDTIVEAAFDEGSIEAGAKSEAVSELELELKGGCLGPMYQLATQLQLLAPMWISTESKSARGWHLLTGQTEGATEAKTPKLRRRISAANAFREIIGETLGHLTSNIAPTLRDDAEGIHQMRSALRASRAALELFESRLDPMTVGRFDSELRRFGRLFGFARDWGVFSLQTLPAAMAELPAERLWDLKQVAETERRRTHAAVVDAVRSQDFTAMVLGLAAWTEEGCAQPPAPGDDRLAKPLATLAPSLLRRVAGFTKRREHHGSKLSAEKRHRLRKSLDKLRDDVEFFTGLFPRRAVEAYCDRCAELQAILGIANDAVVTKKLALSLVTDQRPDLAKPAAALSQWSDRRGRKALRGFGGALRDFRAAPLFWQ